MMNRNFVWLLKRELWEYRGAMLWAPVIVGCLMCALLAVGLLAGGGMGHNFVLQIDGETVTNTAAALGEQRMQQLIQGVGIGFLVTMGALFLIPSFVIFFYCLGTLFDERRDRSVLFWKSLPISDTVTVLSKVTTALVVAPFITLVVATSPRWWCC
jgi:ABC-2 type transport system permease protein